MDERNELRRRGIPRRIAPHLSGAARSPPRNSGASSQMRARSRAQHWSSEAAAPNRSAPQPFDHDRGYGYIHPPPLVPVMQDPSSFVAPSAANGLAYDHPNGNEHHLSTSRNDHRLDCDPMRMGHSGPARGRSRGGAMFSQRDSRPSRREGGNRGQGQGQGQRSPSTSSSPYESVGHYGHFADLAPSLRRPSTRSSSSNLIIDPDLLILDMRLYGELEDALTMVKSFLDNVRNLAMERGLHALDSGRQPSLFVSIIIGEGGDGSPRTFLYKALKNVFNARDIQFMIADNGESLHVDALSGARDGHEMPFTAAAVSPLDHGEIIVRNENILPPSLGSLPHPHHSNDRLAMMLHQARLDEEEAAAAMLRAARATHDLHHPPPIDDHDEAMPAMHTGFLHHQSDPSRRSWSDNSPHEFPQQSMENLPPTMPLAQQAPNSYSQGQGSGMIQSQNPYDSMAQSLLNRNSRGGSLGSGGHPTLRQFEVHHDGSCSDASSLSGENFDELPDLAHPRGSNMGYPEVPHQLLQQPLMSSPVSSLDEAALRPTPLARTQPPNIDGSSSRNGNSSHRNSQSPSNTPPTHANQPSGMVTSSQRMQSDFRQAVNDSQATHIAHTQRQVIHDIQFRREMERASNESAVVVQVQPSSEGLGENRGRFECTETDVEALAHHASRMTFQEEETRRRDSQVKFELELERVLQESEQATLQQQAEEKRLELYEQELIQEVMAKTQAAEEEGLRSEEEFLRRALAQSMMEDAAVKEEDILEEAIMRSQEEAECQNRMSKVDTEEIIEKVLKLSIDEVEYIDPKEAENLKKAMEASKLDDPFVKVTWQTAPTCKRASSSSRTCVGPIDHE